MAWWDHEELKAPEDRSDRYKRTFPDEYTTNKEKFDHARLSPTEDWNVRFAHDIPGGHQLEETRNKKDLNMKYVVLRDGGAPEIVDEDTVKNMNLGAKDRVYRLGSEVKLKTMIVDTDSSRYNDINMGTTGQEDNVEKYKYGHKY
jgi:hypothetical protein